MKNITKIKNSFHIYTIQFLMQYLTVKNVKNHQIKYKDVYTHIYPITQGLKIQGSLGCLANKWSKFISS